MRGPRPFFALAVAAVLVAAAWLRFWALDMGLPFRLARPDETPILLRTVHAAQGRFDFDWAAYPHAYLYLHWLWGQGVLALQYALGLAESADYARAWEVDHERLYRIGRTLSALCGVAVVALVIELARRHLDRAVAIGAGAWTAVCLLLVRDSHAIKPDMPTTLAVTLALAAAIPLARRPTPTRGVVAGLAVGAACAMKYSGVIAAVPVAAAAWWGAPRDAPLLRRALPPGLLVAGACAAAFFLLTSPFLLTNPSSQGMIQATLQAVFPSLYTAPPEAAEALAIEGPQAPAWAARFGALGPLVYHALFSMRHGTGLLPSLLAPIAIAWGLLRREVLLRLSAVLVLAWIAVVSLSPVMLSRYLTPMLPALAILEVACLATALRRLTLPPPRFAAALALAVALLLAETARDAWAFDRLAAREDTRNRATRWLARNVAPGSRIGIVGTRFLPWGAPEVPPTMQRVPLERRRAVDPRRVDYVVSHDHELFWSTVEPEWHARNAGRLELLVDLDPAAGGVGRAVFEMNDAFYLPIDGFAGVTAPGPHVRIYHVLRRGDAGARSPRRR